MLKIFIQHLRDPSSMIGKVVANITWLAFGNVITAMLAIVISLWMASHFGPHDYGMYAFVLSIVMLISPIADMGISSILVRELAQADHSEPVNMGSGFMIRLVSTSIVGAVTGLSVMLWFADDPLLRRYVYIGLITLVPRLLNIAEASLNARVQSRYAVIARLVATVSITLARVGGLLTNQPLELFIWLSILQAAIEGSVMFYYYQKHHGCVMRWYSSGTRCMQLIKASWPLLVSGISVSILVRFDQVMLQQYAGEAAVGQYSVALLFTEGPSFIPMIICTSVFPGLVQVRKINAALYIKRNQQFHNVVIWAGILMVLGINLLGPMVVRLLLGDVYEVSLAVLPILTGCTFMVAAAVVQSHYMMVEDIQWIGSVARVVGGALNILLNGLWIPRYGLAGAAYASLVSYLVIVLVIPAIIPQSRVCILHFVYALSMPWRVIVQRRSTT